MNTPLEERGESEENSNLIKPFSISHRPSSLHTISKHRLSPFSIRKTAFKKYLFFRQKEISNIDLRIEKKPPFKSYSKILIVSMLKQAGISIEEKKFERETNKLRQTSISHREAKHEIWKIKVRCDAIAPSPRPPFFHLRLWAVRSI